MNATPLDPGLISTFVMVAEESSFSRAARRLNVTTGTVSRAVQRLEVLVGAALLRRTTHAVSLSTAGTALYERTAPHLRALRDALVTLPERDAEPAGVLRITAPPDFGSILLPALISRFSLRYPAVRFDLHLTNTLVDLVKERIDLAIRPIIGAVRDSSLTMRKLGYTTVVFCAAPAYIARRGLPREAFDPKHDWVNMPFARKRLARMFPAAEARVVVNDVLAVRALIVEGLGIGLLPAFVAEPEIAAGRLARVLANERSIPRAPFAIVHHAILPLPRKVTAFRDFLLNHVKAKGFVA